MGVGVSDQTDHTTTLGDPNREQHSKEINAATWTLGICLLSFAV